MIFGCIYQLVYLGAFKRFCYEYWHQYENIEKKILLIDALAEGKRLGTSNQAATKEDFAKDVNCPPALAGGLQVSTNKT